MMLNIEIIGFSELNEDDLLLEEERMQTDMLKESLKAKKNEAMKYIINAAKLIAPMISNGDVISGYDFILDTLKTSNYPEIESEIEICKGMAYLKHKDIEKAIETMKGFEKKDKTLMAKTASNISFLYFLESDIKVIIFFIETF